jgi:hypothetical protein
MKRPIQEEPMENNEIKTDEYHINIIAQQYPSVFIALFSIGSS